VSSCGINISILQVPSDYNIVGVSRLQLCDGQQWKERVDVCLELLSTEIQGPFPVQGQNCSFGMLKFERWPRSMTNVDDRTCRPQKGLCVCAVVYTLVVASLAMFSSLQQIRPSAVTKSTVSTLLFTHV